MDSKIIRNHPKTPILSAAWYNIRVYTKKLASTLAFWRRNKFRCFWKKNYNALN